MTALDKMQKSTLYRGPDASRTLSEQKEKWNLALGVNRLQIVDRNEQSNQPLVSACGNYVLAFNGEVYNYQDLKNKLLTQGYQFNTASDTEVVLYWLQEFGTNGLSALKGMFALCYVNLPERSLLIARDKQGIKPLFFSFSQGQVVASSSIKAIKASGLVKLTQNLNAIHEYLAYRHVLGNHTFYKEVNTLAPGHALLLAADMSHTITPFILNAKDQPTDIKTALITSLELQFTGPSTPGLLLSGGVDSTLLLAILRNEMGVRGINSYTLETREDTRWARKAAQQFASNHHEIQCSIEHLTSIDEFLDNTDQPIGDHGAFATWLVAKEAAKDSKVLLSGAGADELMGGYNRHRAYYYYLSNQHRVLFIKNMFVALQLTGLLPNALKQFIKGVNADPAITYFNFLQNYAINRTSPNLLLFRNNSSPDGFMQEVLAFDQRNYLINDVLAITDNSLMQHSIEGRVPYLYDDVVATTKRISIKEKMLQGGKGPLKELLINYGGKTFSQRKKHGFGLPLADWFRKKESLWLWEFMTKDSPIFNYVNKSTVYQFIRLHQQAKMDYSMQLWSILVLEKWLSEHSL